MFSTNQLAHLLGIAILKNDFELATSLFYYRNTRYTKDVHYFLNKYDKTGEVYYQTLREMPLQEILFAIRSYTAYVFNSMVNYRLEMDSENLLVGDFVVKNNEKLLKGDPNLFEDEIHVITDQTKKEDIDSGKYSIRDLALPILGNKINIPENLNDFIEREIEGKQNLQFPESFVKPPNFLSKNKHMRLNLDGAYRPVFRKIENLQIEVHRDVDKDSNVLDDFGDFVSKENKNNSLSEKKAQNYIENYLNKRIAKPMMKEDILHLKFDLQKGSYATVALREMLGKNDVSF